MMETETQTASVPQYTRRVRHDAELLAQSVQEAAGQVEKSIAESLRERPWTTLAVAAGAGFVVGGGLATRMTRVMLAMGGRLAFAMVMQELGARVGLKAPSASDTNNDRRNP
jgi:hypothetical protein